MMILDLLMVCAFVLCWVSPIKSPSFFARLLGHLLFSCIPLTAGFLACRWKSRYRTAKKREALLTLPVQTIRGQISSVYPLDTGKTQVVSTPTGWSQEGIAGRTYWHYTYNSVPVYDGYIATISKPDDKYWPILDVRTLPKNFLETKETIPQYPGVVTVSYVTDSDGINYFLGASQN